MPPAAAHYIASITDGFSFAYLKEAYMASLLMLVRNSADNGMPAEEEEDDKIWGRLGNLLPKQIALLREEMAEVDKIEAEREKKEEGWPMMKKTGTAVATKA